MTFDAWKFAASTLRLELYGHGKDYATGLSFSSLARATHDTIDEPSYDNTNMRGRWHVQAAGRSFDVLVMREAVHGNKHTYYYTRVMARIPRPLFVGLLFSNPRPMDPLFGPPNPMSGERELDGRFSFVAAYPDEALAILRRAVATPNDAVDHLLAAAERCREVTVTDTSVEVVENFTTERIHAGNIIQFGQDGPRLSVVWFEVFTDSVAPIPPKRSPEPANPTPVQGTPPIVPTPAEPPSPPQNTEMHARLRFADHPNEKPVEIIRAELTFGREPSCDVAFDADKVMVSRNHAVLRKKGAAVMIEDNGSFNGTFVNEQRIASPTQLFHNDQIRFGIGGPVLILDAPSLVAGPDDEPGYMSAEAIASLAAQFDLPDTGGSKTVVARITGDPT